MNRLLPCVLVLILDGIVAAALGPMDYFSPAEERGGWRALVPANTAPSPQQETAIRERTGLDWNRILDAWTYCTSFGGPHSLLLIRHGWIVGEWHNFTQP
jgi:hypothetical protein